MKPTRPLRRTRTVLKKLAPQALAKSHSTRQIISAFADRMGLVYFGHVDARSEAHHLIRGHTVSTSHRDSYYCVGTYKSYDVSLVLRSDHIQHGAKKIKEHNWLIFSFDLKRGAHLPPFYIGHETNADIYSLKHSRLLPLGPSHLPDVDKNFYKSFTIYALAAYLPQISLLLRPELLETIGQKFGSTSIEFVDGVLYMQIPSQHPSRVLLETMLENGVWLADSLDTLARQLAD